MSEHDLHAERSGAGRSGAASDRLLIADYLDGQHSAFQTLDAWVRQELSTRFPVLRQERADLCQITHEKLVRALRDGEFQHRSSLKTWVVRITRYTAVDWLRRTHRDRLLEDESLLADMAADQGPYRSLVSRELAATLANILALAPKSCRELWRLAFVEGLGFRQIAARLGIAHGTVKSRMWYCRRRAFQLLSRLLGKGSTFGDLL